MKFLLKRSRLRSAHVLVWVCMSVLTMSALTHAQGQGVTTAPTTAPATQPALAPSNHGTLRDIPYRTGANLTDDMREFCKLDLQYPTAENSKGFATLIWFHGGGMKAGKRGIPGGLQNQGIAVVGAGYRLAPRARSPEYIEDAAAAVAWVRRHIHEYGGDPARIFVSGHSAGGYLALMVGLDKHYLKAHGVDANELAGLAPLSPQVITHMAVRAERQIPATRPVVDALAPLHHVRPDAPQILLITGDRNLELLGRYEENAYFWRMMKVAGHQRIELVEIEGQDHEKMVGPGLPRVLQFMRTASGKKVIGTDE